jgi:peroxiredoxin
MKRIILLILCLILIISCEKSEQTATISGDINFPDGRVGDTLYISIYKFYNTTYLGQPLLHMRQIDNTFSFDLKPGSYTVAVYNFGAENYRDNIFIPDNKISLNLNITMRKKGVYEEVEEVRICGDFCKRSGHEGIKLTKIEDVWKLEDTSIIKKDESYEFLTYGYGGDVYDMRNERAKFIEGVGFKSIYDGREIIFDPALYNIGILKSTSDIKKYSFQKEFNSLLNSLDDVESELRKMMPNMRDATLEERRKIYDSLYTEINNLNEFVSPIYRPMIIEKQLAHLRYNHPSFSLYRNTRKNGKIDSSALKKFATSELTKDYFFTSFNLLEQIDPKSYLVNGEFIGNLLSLDIYARKIRSVGEKIEFNESFPFEYILDFIENSKDTLLCSGILYRVADYYSEVNEPDKATYLINLLKSEYPDNIYSVEGHTDRMLARLKIQVGIEAPVFSVQSVEGDSLKLLDYRGKFVFIDFWGSWCGPCIGELPNLKKLAKTFSSEQLQIIGLAEDDSARFVSYLESNPLPYPNALAGKIVLNQYGINKFPTTFLIDPRGKIAAIDLRGEDLVTLVKEKMSEYQM